MGSVEPAPGMVIFFAWDDESGQDGQPDHVGIVARVETEGAIPSKGTSAIPVRRKVILLGIMRFLVTESPLIDL